MKNAIYSLLLCLLSLPGFAQVVAIQNDKIKTLYIGVNNELTIASEQCPYDSIRITCRNGTILKNDGDHNHYIVTVDSPGTAYIDISRKTGKDYSLVDSRRYKIEYLPDPTPIYARRQGGEIALSEIDESYLLIAKQLGYDRNLKYVIDSFTLMIIRDDKMVFMRRQRGGDKMDDVTLAFLKTLQANDKMLFTGITCKAPDKRLLHLHALELTVTDRVTVNGTEKKQ